MRFSQREGSKEIRLCHQQTALFYIYCTRAMTPTASSQKPKPVIAVVAAVLLAATAVVDEAAADDVVAGEEDSAAVEVPGALTMIVEFAADAAAVVVDAAAVSDAADPVSVLVGVMVVARLPLMVLVTFTMLELPPVAPVSSKSGKQSYSSRVMVSI